MKAWIIMATVLVLGQADARSMRISSLRMDLETLRASMELITEDDDVMDAMGMSAKIQSVFLVGGEMAYQFGFTRPTPGSTTESCVMMTGIDLTQQKVTVLNLDCQEVTTPRNTAMVPVEANDTFHVARVAPTYRSTREVKALINYIQADKLMLNKNSPSFSRLLGLQKNGEEWTMTFRRQSVGPVCKVSYTVHTRMRPGMSGEPQMWFHRTGDAACSRR
ncbi:MAG: hypothetical protein IT288_07620 [Bdellovibrionales bacterium]|nr:hypothetical protein [Bdellovibrionales bacterium]